MSKWATLTAFSLAQVYVAETLSSGLPVAVKVQYADLRERFDSDVATFKAILDGIEVMHPKFGFAWILDELSENMENELDFQVRPQCPAGFFYRLTPVSKPVNKRLVYCCCSCWDKIHILT